MALSIPPKKLRKLARNTSVGLWPANLAAADGKILYDGKCVPCHGSDGKGKQKIADMYKVNVKIKSILC